MSHGGWSAARRGRLHDVMAGHVERGGVPGVVTLVSRRGETHVDAVGLRAHGAAARNRPVARDTLFRITSMTKPVSAVAALMLVEEGRLRLDEPVDRLLPELAGRRVLRQLDGPVDDTVPARRPITLRDLLIFRLGFGIPLLPPGATPIQRAEAEHRLMTLGPPTPPSPHEPDEWLRRFATLPLMFQPGEVWMYGTGSHLLGILIARASGQSLPDFLRQRIFEPLGMQDTGFSVPAGQLDRLVDCYRNDSATGEPVLLDGADDSHWSRPPAFPDAAAGLVSTVDDYLAFARMLLAGGKHGHERLLSRPAVELMTTDQLTPEQRAGAVGFLGEGRGWGFGVSIVIRRHDLGSVGRYGWDGGYGTSWANDPREDLIAILMTQTLWDSPSPPEVYLDFWSAVYQAIDD